MRAPFRSFSADEIEIPHPTAECSVILRLTVQNHPGVMSQICGLFARRAFNLDGILCMPMKDERHSRIWLRLHRPLRLDQVIKQLAKLHDVLEVKQHDLKHHVFVELEEYFSGSEA